MEPIFEVRNMNKSFGIVKALKDVSLSIYGGEIRGLIGENGSGKSTVSSIIAGIQNADSGEMFYKGKPYHRANTVDAQRQGISMIVQEIGTIGSITVAQNIFLGRERDFKKGPFIFPKYMINKAQDLLNRVALGHINAAQITEQQTLEDRKLIELARAMQDEPSLLIVDETTTALSQSGRERMYGIMERMARDGKAVLFISHDLDELMNICNTLTVLRDGVIIGNLKKEEFETKRIKQMMVGREVAENYYRTDYGAYESGETVLCAENVSTEHILENVSMELHKGEILGIGGLSSCGMHELGRVLFGAEPAITGQVTVYPSGHKITDIKSAILNKIGYVSKNRDEEALILRDTIGHNLTSSALYQLSKWGVISPGKEKQFAKKQIDDLEIKCYGDFQEVSTLSGGNKQKVSFGKWVGNDSDIIIFDCPTRGVDVGVKATMYNLLYELRNQGKAILLISEDMAEVLGMSDRILILKDGELSKEFYRDKNLSEHDVIEYLI